MYFNPRENAETVCAVLDIRCNRHILLGPAQENQKSLTSYQKSYIIKKQQKPGSQ